MTCLFDCLCCIFRCMGCASAPKPPIISILGEPGSGKSSLLNTLVFFNSGKRIVPYNWPHQTPLFSRASHSKGLDVKLIVSPNKHKFIFYDVPFHMWNLPLWSKILDVSRAVFYVIDLSDSLVRESCLELSESYNNRLAGKLAQAKSVMDQRIEKVDLFLLVFNKYDKAPGEPGTFNVTQCQAFVDFFSVLPPVYCDKLRFVHVNALSDRSCQAVLWQAERLFFVERRCTSFAFDI